MTSPARSSPLRLRLRALVVAALGAATPLVLARVASAALTFALPLALVRQLDADAFGSYKQFFLLATSVILVGQCGLTQSLYYFLPRGGPTRGTYLAQALGLLWVVALVVGVTLYFTAPTVTAWFGAGQLAGVRTPLALTTALLLAAAPLEAALTADGRIGAAAVAYMAGDGLRAAALICAARWAGPVGVFWASGGVAFVRLAALVTLLVRGYLPVARPSLARLRQQLRFTLPFAGASLFFVGQRYCAQYLVSARVDAATFPLFTIALFHLPMVDIVFTPITEVLMVVLGRTIGHDPRTSLRCFHDSVNKLAAILFPAAAGAWLLGATVLPVLFTARWAAAVPLFYIATLEIPLCVLPVDALLRAAGDTRFLFWFNAARVVVTVAAVGFGLRAAGLGGAMAATVACEGVARVAMLARGRIFLGRPELSRLLDWRFLGRTAIASAAACVPAFGMRFTVARGLPCMIASMAVYGAVYLFARGAMRAPAVPAPAT